MTISHRSKLWFSLRVRSKENFDFNTRNVVTDFNNDVNRMFLNLRQLYSFLYLCCDLCGHNNYCRPYHLYSYFIEIIIPFIFYKFLLSLATSSSAGSTVFPPSLSLSLSLSHTHTHTRTNIHTLSPFSSISIIHYSWQIL